jgi:hypothetical protein
MVIMLAFSVVDHGFELQSKNYKIGISCFSFSIKEEEQRLVGSEFG